MWKRGIKHKTKSKRQRQINEKQKEERERNSNGQMMMMMVMPEREQNNQYKIIENHSKINKVSNLHVSTEMYSGKNYKNKNIQLGEITALQGFKKGTLWASSSKSKSPINGKNNIAISLHFKETVE